MHGKTDNSSTVNYNGDVPSDYLKKQISYSRL